MSHTILIAYYGTNGNVSTGYTPSFSIYELPSDTLMDSGTGTYNSTLKKYEYEFLGFDSTKEYIVNIDFGASAPTRYASVKISEIVGGGVGGLTTEEHNKLMNLIGGGFNNGTLDAQEREWIKKTYERAQKLDKDINEINSHIDIAKTEVIDTIKEVETEVCSDIIRKTKEIKEDNITTRNLVRQKTKKIDENVSKLADRQELIDKAIEREANELEEQIEQMYETEAEQFEKDLDEILNKEFDEVEKEINSNQESNGNT